MFDYQVSKHPHFDEACRAFALRHNLVQLAERAGMNVQILRNKLNPAQPHLLTAPEIWLLTDLTEDSTLVDGFLAQIHCLPCVPINEVAKEKLPHYVMSATAEIGRVAAGAVTARSKKGRIKRQMFAKLRTTKYLKTAASADSASVQFEGKVQRIARVHHYGLRDRVSPKGGVIKYPSRKLLGLNEHTENEVRDLLLKYFLMKN